MGRRRHLLQGQAGVEVFLDVRDDGAELPRGAHPSVRPAGGRGAGAVRIRWTARRLARDSAASRPPAASAVSSSFTASIAARSCGRSRPSSGGTDTRAGVEIERLRGDPCDQPRLQEDVEGVRVTAPAPPGRAAGRHHQDRASRGRDDPADPFVPQLELPWRTDEQKERMVSQGGLESLIGGLVTVAKRLQAHPP